MNRVQAIGLSLVALLALCAVSAASASAATFKFESSPSWLHGEQATKTVFTVSGGTIKCSVATFTSGEIVGTSVSSVTIHPTLSGCVAFGQAASVNTSSCNDVLTAPSATAGNVSIVCSGGGVITIALASGECSVTIAGHTPTGNSLTYSNQGSGATAAVLITWGVTGITYSVSPGGKACGASGSNATHSGSALLKAYGTASFSSQHGFSVG